MIYEVVNWFFIVFELLKTLHIPFFFIKKKKKRKKKKRETTIKIKNKNLSCTTRKSMATLYNFKDSKVAQSIRNHNSLSEGNNSNKLTPLLRAKTYFKKSWLQI